MIGSLILNRSYGVVVDNFRSSVDREVGVSDTIDFYMGW